MGVYPQRNLSQPHILSLQLSLLEIVTMWFDTDGKKKPRLYSVLIRFLFLCNSVILIACTVALLVKAITTKDLVDRSEAMDIFTLTGSAFFKMAFFFSNHEQFVDMINCCLALTAHLPPNWMKNSYLFSKIHCSAGFLAIFFWCSCPVLKWIFGETASLVGYPINIYDPYDCEGLTYLVLYTISAYGVLLGAQIYMAADCYLFTSIYISLGALTTLNNKLKDMEYQVQMFSTAATETDALEKLKQCVQLQTHILEFIRKTDKLFRSMILADVVHAIISLSFAMLQASESKGILESIKTFIFVFVCFAHQFLNSFFGQNLIDKQDDVNENVLVAIPWADSSRIFKKSYLMMVTASKHAMRLSAWSVYVLQYATFLEFVKSMVSYYMVLRQVQDEAKDQ